MDGGNITPVQFATGVLQGVGAPVNRTNIAGLVGWAKAEGGNYNGAAYNFLNTTQPMPGAGNTGSQGNIKVYTSPEQGIAATVQTLKNGNYGNILQALRESNPGALAQAIGSSPWGTSGSLVRQTISQALGGKISFPQGMNSTPIQPLGSTGGSSTGIINALLQDANTPVNMNGSIGGNDHLMNALLAGGGGNSGNNTPSPGHLPSIPTIDSTGNVNVPPGTHDINPIPGATIGRTDMGVDANLPVGHPILALNTSRVTNIIPNWYQGQPLVELQILSGPNAGKQWYVAEQIQGIPKVGQVIQRGQVVTRYAGSGTGIEIGWGGPSGQTLAQSEGNTGGPGHSNSPAGQSFLGELHSTGA